MIIDYTDISVEAYKAPDGHIEVKIDTSATWPEDPGGPQIRIILNEDFEDPIYNNT